MPLGESTLGESGRALALLLAGAGLVLLIACANVASLLLARASRRRREIVTRIALGATLPRLLRQLLVESGLLGVASGMVSLAVAYGAVNVFSDVRLAMELPFAFEPRFDATVWAFVLGVSLLTSVAFGLAPAAHVARFGQPGGGPWQDRGSSAAAERGGRWLVASQIAVTVVLLGMGGLLFRSLANLSHVALGFEPERIVSAAIDLPPARYEDGAAIRGFIDVLLDDVGSLPGVEAVAVASQVPFGGSRPNFPLSIEGREGERDRFNAMGVVASDAFFRLMGISLVRGRVFGRRDGYAQPWVVVINETMAETYWPGADPIGQRIRFAGAPKASTIIGIVRDVEYDDVQAGPERQLYVPHRQLSQPNWFLVVRSEPGLSSSETTRAVRERVGSLDSRLPLADVRTLTSLADESLELPRFRASLLGLYAGVAFAIAMGGLFAMLSLSVARRTSEIGVRMALGADARDVSRLVVGGGMKLAFVGAVVGLAATVGVARYVSSFLFGVSPSDPLILATIAALVLGAAAVASYLPARRATRTDPTVALRHE